MIFILAVTDWLKSQSLLEISGVISGILCVYLAARNNIWNWPIAIISVLIYTFIFFEEKLYADAGLQIYFLFTNIYGWYFWAKKSTEYNKTPVSFASKKLIFLSILSIFLFTFLNNMSVDNDKNKIWILILEIVLVVILIVVV